MANLHCRAETKKLLANLRRRKNQYVIIHMLIIILTLLFCFCSSNVRTQSNEEKPMKPEVPQFIKVSKKQFIDLGRLATLRRR